MGVHYSNLVKSFAPAAYYRFGETSGATAYDSSGNGRNATYSITYGYLGAAGGVLYDPNASVSLNLYSYDKVTPPSTLPSLTGDFTIRAIARLDVANANTYGTIFHATGTSDALWFALNKGGGVVFAGQYLSVGGLDVSQWHEYAWTHASASNANVAYIDGVAVGSATYAVAQTTAASAMIGQRNDGGWPFQGQLDEVSIHPAALTAANLLAIAQARQQKFLPHRRGPGRRAA